MVEFWMGSHRRKWQWMWWRRKITPSSKHPELIVVTTPSLSDLSQIGFESTCAYWVYMGSCPQCQVRELPVDLIHPALCNSWKVHQKNPMCFLFDYTYPARQFKCNKLFSEMANFPQYGKPPFNDLTEWRGGSLCTVRPNDIQVGILLHQLFDAASSWLCCRREVRFQYNFDVMTFFSWTVGQVLEIQMTKLRRKKNKQSIYLSTMTHNIPIAYLWIIDQLHKESEHAHHNGGHEAQCCADCTKRTLDAFGNKVYNLQEDGMAFWSKVLNLILQRQAAGVPTHYTPAVASAIGVEPLNICDITSFYLSLDPINPSMIPLYWRNLVYIPEA